MTLKHVQQLPLPGILLIRPRVFADARGRFVEIWNSARDAGLVDAPAFVQDNVVFSRHGVLRGLHFQQPHPQGKYVAAVSGSIYDVAVDLRPGSATFGRWLAQELHAEKGEAIYIPSGFAHGYQTISPEAVVLYKCTEYYHPDCDRAIAWNDPELNIEWPIADPILSDKDRNAPTLESVCGQLGLRVAL